MSNDFIWPQERYKQKIDPINQYIEQGATFLSIQRGISVQDAKKEIQAILRTKGLTNFHDPEVVFFERDDDWNKRLKTGTLSGYLASAKANNEVLVPTMTTYVDPAVEQSLSSVFMKRNAGRRGVLKHQAQEEEMKGNAELAYQLNNQQDNAKRNNNSMSGVMAATGSIFENPTGHNTLTSITRSMSSISNALNERMIGGNRHYYDSDTAINNMTAVAHTMDVKLVRQAIDLYGLRVPSAQEIGAIVKRSSDKYWRDPRHIQKVMDYAEKMTAEQRCAFAYTQDLYHTRVLNPEFMRSFINDFAVWDERLEISDPIQYIKSLDPLIGNYAHQFFISKLRPIKSKNYKDWPPEIVLMVAKACMTIAKAIQKYKVFIDAFLVVDTVPCSTAYINHMCRETVVLSDTDSTMFSVDDWVIWYFGKLVFDDFAFAVAGSIMFVSTQLISHAMALLSANMNVARDKLFVLAMKPEFVFPVFAQTPVAKHYFCSMSVKEGGVYEKNKYEIKGVHLKNSAISAEIIHADQERMRKILDDVEAGLTIDEFDEVTRVADLERKIKNSVLSGESTYLKKMFVKDPRSYQKPPNESPYRYHTLWNEVFGPSYSEVDAPPYIILKLPMTTTSKKKMAEWIAGFEDRALAERYIRYLQTNGKTEIKTMYISQDFVQAYGIPREIQRAIDIQKVVLDLTVTSRLVLDTIGIHPKKDTLLSDQGY